MKVLEKLKTHSWLVSLILVSLVFFKQCSVSRDQDKIQKDIKQIAGKVDSLPTSDQVKQTVNESMFNFLIYENDFDSKKTSLSEIKSKIDGQK
jgi:hypothetical protein